MDGVTLCNGEGYEYLRHDLGRRHITKPEWRLVALWMIVGLGYAVRAGLAFWVAGLWTNELASAAGVACFAAFGIMFVLVTWVLEAASYCKHRRRR